MNESHIICIVLGMVSSNETRMKPLLSLMLSVLPILALNFTTNIFDLEKKTGKNYLHEMVE